MIETIGLVVLKWRFKYREKYFQKYHRKILPIKIFFVSLHLEIRIKNMEKQLNISEDYLRRSDKGGTHGRWAWGGIPIGMYNYAGTLEREFEDIYDAMENSGVKGVTYKGIVACCEGKIRTHAGKIWRKGLKGGDE